MTSSFSLDIVSPQFPCGAAWLANAMLELNVPLHELWGFATAREWTHGPHGQSVYSAAGLPWRQTLASLKLGRVFEFRNHIRPRFSHAYPWQIAPCAQVVWMVRDPRDALFSEWRRQRHNGGLPAATEFVEFLQTPFDGGPISNVDMLWLHLRAWMAVMEQAEDQVYLLRFEDWKLDPVDSLRRVCEWAGVQAEPEALLRAAHASDVQHLLAIEKSLHCADPNARQFNRAGIAEEWRSTWDATWFCAMGAHWQPVLAKLGYAPLSASSTSVPTFCLEDVLAWRGLGPSAQFDQWHALLLN